ncbi:RNA polymerase beta [Enterobacter sp. FY-07]|nr:RNA polymerase beta [Enterobacter sp. FY-07]
MHRIDTSTAQVDKFGAGKNGFTAGNPQTGTPATDLDEAFFDMLQEELAGVVEASGAVLDKTKHNQLLTALKALLLSRANPFGDIKADGAAAVALALSNLGLKEAATGVGVVGSSRNARMNIAAASTTATFTADELIVSTALGGKVYRLSNVNKTINLAITGVGGMDSGAAPSNGFVAVYTIYNPTTDTDGLLGVNATAAAVPEICASANIPAGYIASALVAVLPVSSLQFSAASVAGRNVSIVGVSVLSGNGAPGSLVALSMSGVPYNAVSLDMVITAGLITADTTGSIEIAPASNLVGARRVSVGGSSTGGTISNTSFSQMPVFNNSKTMYWHTLSASIAYTVVVEGYSF